MLGLWYAPTAHEHACHVCMQTYSLRPTHILSCTCLLAITILSLEEKTSTTPMGVIRETPERSRVTFGYSSMKDHQEE